MTTRNDRGRAECLVALFAAVIVGLTAVTDSAQAARNADVALTRSEQDQPSSTRTRLPARPGRKSVRTAPTPAPNNAAAEGQAEQAVPSPAGAEPVPAAFPPEVQARIEAAKADRAAEEQAEQDTPVGPNPASVPAAQSPPAVNPLEGLAQSRRTAGDRRRQMRQPGTPRGSPTTPGVVPGGGDAVVGSAINIPPAENDVPPEDRLYSFSIKDAPYSVLIEGIAQQTGLGIIGSAPPDGTVTFITDEQLTFDELMQRVRELLFNYKPIDPYWILREENGLRVVRVVDYLRELKPELMFKSVEEFQKANLPDHELVLVLYTPKKGSLSDLTVVRDFLPDYLRVTPMENSNTVAIFALVRDIKKYLELVDIFVTPGGKDPRTLELIPVQFTSPSQAYAQLQKLMDSETGPDGVARPRLRRGQPTGSPLESIPEPPVSIVPDDAQGVLIVRAMQDKIAEIKDLLKVVDVDTETKFTPAVIEVKYNAPDAIINTVQQILSTGGTATPTAPTTSGRRRSRRPRTPQPNPGQPADSGITMIPHPAGGAIIVLADDETVAQVRKLVQQLDIQTTADPTFIAIEYAEPEVLVAAITQMVSGPGAGGPRGRAPGAETSVSIVTDPGGTGIWVTGTPRDVERIRGLVKEMDRAQDAPTLHVVQLVNQKPSFVAQILTQVDAGGGSVAIGGSTPPRGRRPRRPPARAGAAGVDSSTKFNPVDETRRLFILCTDAEWTQYKAVIDDLESETPVAEFEVVTVENIAPEEAIEKIQTIIAGGVPGGAAPPRNVTTGLRMIASDTGIIVMGATPVDLSTIRAILAEIDKPVDIEQRTFVVEHVNPADLKVALEQLFADGVTPGNPRRPRGRRGVPAAPTATPGGSASMTIVQVSNTLVVKAPPDVMTQVAEFIGEFDVPRDKPEMRVYDDFPRGTDMYQLVEAVQSLLTDSGGRQAVRGQRPADLVPTEGEFVPRFVPQQAAGRLIVMARPEQFAEIETTLETLKSEITVTPIVTEFIPLKHADADAVVEQVDPLLALHVERLIAQGEIAEAADDAGGAPNPVAQRGARRVPRPVAGGTQRPYQLLADAANRRIVIAAEEPIVAEARKLISAFDVPGSAVEPVEVAYINVKYANPEDIVSAIEPVIAMKVQEFVAGGEIAPEAPTVTPDQPGQKGVRRGRMPQAMNRETRRYHLAADLRQRRLVVAGPKSVIDLTRKLVSDFDLPGSDSGRVEIDYLAVKYATPSELVERMDPFLQIRVQQYFSDEVLGTDETAAGNPAAARIRGAQRGESRRYHLEPDDRNGQIIVAAPRPVIDEARSLVSQMDKPTEGDNIVFETVALENTEPDDMVETISGLMQVPAPKRSNVRVRGGRRGATAPPASATPTAGDDSGPTFTIMAAPGGGAVVLQGSADDVALAKDYVKQLDGKAAGNRTVRVFQIENADLTQLVNMIVSQVGIEEKPGAPGRPQPRHPGVVGAPEEDDFESEFVREITRTGPDLYLHADLIADTLTVFTTPSKMRIIEDLVGKGDAPEMAIVKPVLPQMLYPLKYADAFDAADHLRGLLRAMWQPDDQIPEVDYTSFGNMLVVRYPDESRFPEIEGLIQDYVDKEVRKPLKAKAIPLPPNMTAGEVARWLETNLSDYDVETINKTPTVEEKYGVEEVLPPKPSSPSASRSCVLPLSLVRAMETAGAAVISQTPPEEEPPTDEPAQEGETPPAEPADEAEPQEEEVPPPPPAMPDPLEEMIREKAGQMQESAVPPVSTKGTGGEAARTEKPEPARPNQRQNIRVYYDNSKGEVIIEGPEDAVKDIPDWLDEMEEANKELNPPPDIRIIRVKYIDVRTAESIINEMFNATRQQNQQLQSIQRMRQQQIMQQRRLQQQLARQQAARGGQQPGQQPEQQIPQVEVPSLPEASVRVFANPRDRTLIIRASSHQFSAIYKLLATIDQPRPFDSAYRIYELTRLNAADVESLLREWLGLDQGSNRTSTNRTRRTQRGMPPGQPNVEWTPELPETLVEPVEGDGTGLGIDPTDIKLSSNSQTNTILALAPVAALDYIGNLIDELEKSAGSDRVWRSYQLAHAQAEDVVAFLQERFADMHPGATSGETRAPRGRGDRGTSSSSAPPGLNSPVFVPYARLNMLSVYATEETLPEIEDALKQIDVPAANEQYRHITLVHADAGAVADTLTALFGGGTTRAPTPRGRGNRAAASADQDTSFVGEAGGKIVFYRAPESFYPRIEEVVGQLEEQSKSAGVLRIIQLTHARPSDVAAAIEQAYGSGAATGARRGNRGGPPTATGSEFSVTANDSTRQLFVLASDAKFAEIESLAVALDQPAQMGFDFRIYPLKYADAKRVHETMTKLVQDYLRMLPREQQQLEAFSVQPDEKANALVVLGGPVVFGFVEEALKKVDIPANARDEDGVMMVVLENGDANEVSQSINRLWSQRLQEGEKPPVAEPVRSLNALVVRGTQSQLDSIKKEFIEPLQSQAADQLTTANIPLTFARAEDAAQTLMKIYDERRQAIKELGPQGSAVSPLEQTVVITADPVTNQLIVQASASNLEDIRQRVAQLDVEDVAKMSNVVTKIYTPRIADVETVAAMIRSMAMASDSKSPGRPSPTGPGQSILAIAEPSTRSVVVTASGQNHARIKEIIDQLDSDAAADRAQQMRTFTVKYAEPDIVVDAVTQLFKGGRGKGTGEVTAVVGGGNTVLVNASAVDMARIEDLITKVDSPEANLQKVYVINLENTDAEAVAGTLDQIFVKSASQRKGAGAAQISISALKGSKAVMVRCSPEDYDAIAAAVAEIDREEALMGEAVRVVTLFYTDATEMLEAVQDYLRKPGVGGGKGGAGGDLVGNTRVSVLTQTNALVLSGDKEKVERLVELVHEMDQAGELGSRPKIVVLEHAKVNQVLPVLQDMFGEKGRGGGASRSKGQAPP
ncbi:MAG: hypothetical protein J5J06_09270, partial [Phycisphaerae bacterium]|nr:hypothetical protein [Phycisphaerae bacterium]